MLNKLTVSDVIKYLMDNGKKDLADVVIDAIQGPKTIERIQPITLPQPSIVHFPQPYVPPHPMTPYYGGAISVSSQAPSEYYQSARAASNAQQNVVG